MIKENKTQITMPWLAWSSVALFYAYQYILRVFPSIVMPEIMASYQMDASLFGQYSGIYYIGYGLAHLPLGFWIDRIGPRKIMPLCCLLCIVGLAPLMVESIALYPILGRLLMGIGSSGAILGVFKIIRMAFPSSKFSRILGVTVTIGLVGALYGSQPFYHLIQQYNWQVCVFILMIAGFILAIGMCWTLPDVPQPQQEKIPLRLQIREILGNRNVILICIFAGLMVAPLEGFADIWGTEFLMRLYDQDKAQMAFYPSLIFIGMGIGAPLIGALSDQTGRYFTVIIFSGLVMTISFLILLYAPPSLFWLPMILVLIGIFCAYQIPAITKATFFVSERLVGFTTAFVNMVIMMFGYFYHGAIGAMLNLGHDSVKTMYTLADFKMGLSVVPLGLLIGSLGFIWLHFSAQQRSR